MSTVSWSTRVRHDSDAVYQEWRDEFITKLGVLVTAAVLAADETNITPGAGARPGTTTEQGYAVYHLADTLHGTAPVYIRFGFGTATGATTPRIQVTVGTSTNGTGTLGGTALSSTVSTAGSPSAQTSDTSRQSYMSCVAGFFGFHWKTACGCEASFFICRTCDSTGAPTVTGAFAHWGATFGNQIGQRQAYRYASAAAAYAISGSGIDNSAMGLSPQCRASTTTGSDIQVALGWTITPRVEPLFAVCGVYASELAVGGTFNATLVGSTARTFITLPALAGPFGPVATSTTGGMNIAMIWE
jgi:hypothetical protein